MPDELRIVEVVADEVGQPPNDGTRGSGLYSVPIKLSRPPSAREGQLLIHFWDHPPRFGLMHRPGTARVAGDRFVLGRTTLEEVRDHHAETLKLVVAETNKEEARLQAEDSARAARDTATAEAHRNNVNKLANEIRFDE